MMACYLILLAANLLRASAGFTSGPDYYISGRWPLEPTLEIRYLSSQESLQVIVPPGTVRVS